MDLNRIILDLKAELEVLLKQRVSLVSGLKHASRASPTQGSISRPW